MPTLTTLVSFNGTNGSEPSSGLVADSAGDLFGTTYVGGATRLWHGVRDRQDRQRLRQHADHTGQLQRRRRGISVCQSDRRRRRGPVRHDTLGGANGDGTVFEIAKTASGYASTPTTLVSFNGANGAYPSCRSRSPTLPGTCSARPTSAGPAAAARCSRSPRPPAATPARPPHWSASTAPTGHIRLPV